MKMTKIFKCGNSQAVRLPKDFQLKGEIVEIFKKNKDIVIREIPQNLSKAFTLLTLMPNDFFNDGREDEKPQERDF
ncbi:MAG: AbrB/MazE/SpoVT family DNA-binding domain-containing protein [Gammaproteobacteria bacterium]|nr:AbrB/MazE/SpoVT family DNA-binding domain-containing protein [Gammaproteobacteria bacterium]